MKLEKKYSYLLYDVSRIAKIVLNDFCYEFIDYICNVMYDIEYEINDFSNHTDWEKWKHDANMCYPLYKYMKKAKGIEADFLYYDEIIDLFYDFFESKEFKGIRFIPIPCNYTNYKYMKADYTFENIESTNNLCILEFLFENNEDNFKIKTDAYGWLIDDIQTPFAFDFLFKDWNIIFRRKSKTELKQIMKEASYKTRNQWFGYVDEKTAFPYKSFNYFKIFIELAEDIMSEKYLATDSALSNEIEEEFVIHSKLYFKILEKANLDIDDESPKQIEDYWMLKEKKRLGKCIYSDRIKFLTINLESTSNDMINIENSIKNNLLQLLDKKLDTVMENAYINIKEYSDIRNIKKPIIKYRHPIYVDKEQSGFFKEICEKYDMLERETLYDMFLSFDALHINNLFHKKISLDITLCNRMYETILYDNSYIVENIITNHLKLTDISIKINYYPKKRKNEIFLDYPKPITKEVYAKLELLNNLLSNQEPGNFINAVRYLIQNIK